MRWLRVCWLLAVGLLGVPYLVLFAAGSVWLYQYHVLWIWLACTLLCSLTAWPLIGWLRRKTLARLESPEPDMAWPPSGHAAWQDIEAIALRVQEEDLPLDRWDPWWTVLQEVLLVVARHYHPRSRRPLLEIPVPHVLRVVELVAADLEVAFNQHVPGAHILTLHDIQRVNRLAVFGRLFYTLYRVIQAPINPVAWVVREIRDFSAGQAMRVSAVEVKRWAVGFCVRRAGYYGIQLYSGQLALDRPAREEFRSRRSTSDQQTAENREARLREEPLRILVAGQAKAGKSSLVNALLGQPQASVDAVPRTRLADPYVLDREGLGHAILLDTAGYAQAGHDREILNQLHRELQECDLALLVCSATNAARGADRAILDQWRAYFQADPDRLMPPVAVVLTHIDRLRPPGEWSPPYDLLQPEGAKARNIAEAVAVVAEDLALTPSQVIPVCLASGQVYNVEEALLPAVAEMLPEARRVQGLRCLQQYQHEQYWRQAWRQTANSGRRLWQIGRDWWRAGK